MHEHHHRHARGEQVAEVHDGRPAEQQVERDVEPARRVDPEHAEADADEGAAPDDREQQPALVGREREDRERRVGAGDQQEDVGVVDALEDDLRARLPVEAVVERRVAEQQHRREREHGRRPLRRGAVGEHDQHDAGHDRHAGTCRRGSSRATWASRRRRARARRRGSGCWAGRARASRDRPRDPPCRRAATGSESSSARSADSWRRLGVMVNSVGPRRSASAVSASAGGGVA